jgi:uncharacterized membrane protein
MAWVSGLGALTLAPPIRYLGHSALRDTCLVLLWVQIGIVALVVAPSASTRLTGRGGKTADRLTRPMCLLQWLSVAVLVATLAVVAVTKPAHGGGSLPAPSTMPGLWQAIYGLLAAEMLLVVLLFVFTALCMHDWRRTSGAILRVFWQPVRSMRPSQRAKSDGFSPNLGGFVAPFVARPPEHSRLPNTRCRKAGSPTTRQLSTDLRALGLLATRRVRRCRQPSARLTKRWTYFG